MKFKTEEKFKLIIGQVQKLYDHKNKTSAREVRRKEAEYKLLKAILNKVNLPEVPLEEIHTKNIQFTRKELRAMQALCIGGRRLLNELIIPGYYERLKKAEADDRKDRYQKYVDKARDTDTLYAEILTDIEESL